MSLCLKPEKYLQIIRKTRLFIYFFSCFKYYYDNFFRNTFFVLNYFCSKKKVTNAKKIFFCSVVFAIPYFGLVKAWRFNDMVSVQDHISHPLTSIRCYILFKYAVVLALPLVILEMFQIFMLIKRSLNAIATSFRQTGFCIQHNTWQWKADSLRLTVILFISYRNSYFNMY